MSEENTTEKLAVMRNLIAALEYQNEAQERQIKLLTEALAAQGKLMQAAQLSAERSAGVAERFAALLLQGMQADAQFGAQSGAQGVSELVDNSVDSPFIGS